MVTAAAVVGAIALGAVAIVVAAPGIAQLADRNMFAF